MRQCTKTWRYNTIPAYFREDLRVILHEIRTLITITKLSVIWQIPRETVLKNSLTKTSCKLKKNSFYIRGVTPRIGVAQPTGGWIFPIRISEGATGKSLFPHTAVVVNKKTNNWILLKPKCYVAQAKAFRDNSVGSELRMKRFGVCCS